MSTNIIEVVYYLNGQKFTERLTIEEARKELIDYGYPNVKKMDNENVIKAIKEIL